jgi:hypothetical protein
MVTSLPVMAQYSWSCPDHDWVRIRRVGFDRESLLHQYGAYPDRKRHVVYDSGPYRIVRHPGYAGNILPLAGLVLALGSVWTLIPAAVALIIAVIRTALEDRTLQSEPVIGHFFRQNRPMGGADCKTVDIKSRYVPSVAKTEG